MKRKMAGMVVLVGLLAGGLVSASAEPVVLFSAVESGPDVWVWEGAKLTAKEGKLTLAKDKGGEGDVYLGDRFAYVPEAQIKVDAGEVIAGSYSVQVLAFKGDTFLKAIDLIKDEAEPGGRSFQLSKISIPGGTDRITLKLWISKKPGSAVVFNDISCVLPVEPDNVVYDKQIDPATVATADQADWVPGEGGGSLTLHTNTPVGSLVFPDQIAKPERGVLVLTTSPVMNGTLTVQLCAFDAGGNYLAAVDVIKKAAAGMSTLLDDVAWPEGTATFQVKLWVGGLPGASATISRVLVLK